MHANEVFDSLAAPIHGAQRGLRVRAVSGQVATAHLKDDVPAVPAAVLALIHRLSADIEASASGGVLAFAPALRGGRTDREAGLTFVALCSEQPRFEEVLQHLMGPMPDRADDRMMGVEQGVSGGQWRVPATAELEVPSARPIDVREGPHGQVQSANGCLFHDSQDCLHQMSDRRCECARTGGPSSTQQCSRPTRSSTSDGHASPLDAAAPRQISSWHKPTIHQQRISTKGQARRRSLLGCSRRRELIPLARCSEASW